VARSLVFFLTFNYPCSPPAWDTPQLRLVKRYSHPLSCMGLLTLEPECFHVPWPSPNHPAFASCSFLGMSFPIIVSSEASFPPTKIAFGHTTSLPLKYRALHQPLPSALLVGDLFPPPFSFPTHSPKFPVPYLHRNPPPVYRQNDCSRDSLRTIDLHFSVLSFLLLAS